MASPCRVLAPRDLPLAATGKAGEVDETDEDGGSAAEVAVAGS